MAAPADSRLPLWIRGLIVLALLKVGFALLALPQAARSGSGGEMQILATSLVLLAGAGLGLCMLGTDRRALAVGILFLLSATPFADALLSRAGATVASLSAGLTFLIQMQVAAFLPYFLWRFVGDFPRPLTRRASSLSRAATAAALLIGALLFLANLLIALLPEQDAVSSTLAVLSRAARNSLFWPILFGSMVPAIAFAIWRTRYAGADERRRVRIVMLGLALSMLPVMGFTILGALYPRFGAYINTPEGERTLGFIVYPAMLSAPFSIAYAVLVHRALDVRLIVRQAIRYAIARSALALVLLVPAAGVVSIAYLRRDASIAEMWSEGAGVFLLVSVAVGGVLYRARSRMLEALDRRFFREQYDARRILGDVVARTREVHSTEELAGLVAGELDRALHLRRMEVLLRAPETAELASPRRRVRPLPVTSRIARHLEERAAPAHVDWSGRGGWTGRLGDDERSWLLDQDARLLVPILGTDGELLGLLVLGEKRSELPFTVEDRLLLSTIADAVAFVVESRFAQRRSGSVGTSEPAADPDSPARECLGCGRLGPPGSRRCESCGDATVPTVVPLVLAGKFRMLERLGSGGMGVVYRAVDLELDREVAVKTLPRASAEEVRRLRGEARAMAAVTHPSLASIHGVESWKGVPMLVVELLPRGTLHDRLRHGPLPVAEVIALGRTLLPALQRLHSAGILHRDVKPSNIGFGATGEPKLLDFGLAKVVEAAQLPAASEVPWRSPELPAGSRWESVAAASSATGVGGTPLYLPPEALRGATPGPGYDLWALGVVLYEAAAGRHPYESESILAPERLSPRSVPDVRSSVPDAPPGLADFFRKVLASDPHDRPGSAREMEEWLSRL